MLDIFCHCCVIIMFMLIITVCHKLALTCAIERPEKTDMYIKET